MNEQDRARLADIVAKVWAGNEAGHARLLRRIKEARARRDANKAALAKAGAK